MIITGSKYINLSYSHCLNKEYEMMQYIFQLSLLLLAIYTGINGYYHELNNEWN